MPINTSSMAKSLYPGVSAWYGKAYNEHSKEYPALFDMFTSRRAYEEDVGLSSFGLAAVKREGHSIIFDEERQTWVTRYMNVRYGLGFIVTKELLDDNLYDSVVPRRAQDLAFSMNQTVENVGANVYNRGFNSSYTGGDGVELFSQVHPLYKGGTWSNELLVPADLSEAALEQACIDMMKWTNDAGLKIAVQPLSLHIPVDLVFEAERILKSPARVGTTDNDLNALNHMGKFPGGIKPNHYFTDADAWFVRTNVKHGMKFFMRDNQKFDIDNDWDIENAKFKSTIRFSCGWTDPRGAYGSPGA